MGYSIRVESYFSAAHRLRGYRGKCENLHGHNWKVTVVIESDKLIKPGIVMDFKKAKAMLDSLLLVFDHKDLNRTAYFNKKNPTSELIAEFIFDKYSRKLRKPLILKRVSVWETPTSSATFSKD